MPTSTKIIHIGLDDNRPTYDRVRPYQLDLTILYIHMGYSVFVYIYVSKVTNHALLIIRRT